MDGFGLSVACYGQDTVFIPYVPQWYISCIKCICPSWYGLNMGPVNPPEGEPVSE